LKHAAQANTAAQYLYQSLREIAGLRILTAPQANSVFVELPKSTQQALRAASWKFYDFIAAGGSRLTCSWDTTEADIDLLVADIAAQFRGQ
jgi:threonine aldolase